MAMRNALSACVLLVMGLAACEDASDAPEGLDGGTSTFDAGVGASDAATGALPRAFRIQVARGACYGWCPEVKVAVDQDGRVDYVGGACTARSGVFTRQISRDDAASLYRMLEATGYWTLGDRYADTKVCPALLSDGPSWTWRVTADAREKSLLRNTGCQGIAALDAVAAVEQSILDTVGVRSWIGRGDTSRCYPHLPGTSAQGLAPSYRLSLGAQGIGLLAVDEVNRRWSLTDCNGRALGSGTILFEPTSWLLLDAREVPVALGGDAGVVGGLLIERERDAGVEVRASGLREAENLMLTATPASTCAP